MNIDDKLYRLELALTKAKLGCGCRYMSNNISCLCRNGSMCNSCVELCKTIKEEVDELKEIINKNKFTKLEEHLSLWKRVNDFADSAEMLWTVVANVSGGDWSKQSKEWREAAEKWRDNYFDKLKALGL